LMSKIMKEFYHALFENRIKQYILLKKKPENN